ncbi:RNA-binding protein [Candidatus Woesearchaeota archaeon]|nr:RNA-binding protein [Candidatus Woesearchaeota archaeon]
MKKVSSTSKQDIANDVGSVSFMCPRCGKAEIVRSSKDRAIVVSYTCPECGFTGPN